MSDGVTHERYALTGLALVTSGCVAANMIFDAPVDIYLIAAGASFAFLVDSDMLDQYQVRTRGESRLYNVCYPVGWLVEHYNYPLARMLVHRSIWSHLPPLCRIVRMIYYFLPLAILLFAFGIEIDTFLVSHWRSVLLILMGSALIDVIHVTLDKWEVLC
jgi:hypothetical protein